MCFDNVIHCLFTVKLMLTLFGSHPMGLRSTLVHVGSDLPSIITHFTGHSQVQELMTEVISPSTRPGVRESVPDITVYLNKDAFGEMLCLVIIHCGKRRVEPFTRRRTCHYLMHLQNRQLNNAKGL